MWRPSAAVTDRILPISGRFGARALAAVVAIVVTATMPQAQEKSPFELSIMSFNINDLPAPLRPQALAAMRFIGQDLARRRAEGTAPDVVFLQEAFTRRSKKLVHEAGYPYVVKGPSARALDPASREVSYLDPAERVQGGPQRRFSRLVNSGLYVLSRYPLEMVEKKVYGNDCSGTDCLANKGIVYARIRIPGRPTPIDIATTHMDSNTDDASPKSRFEAHRQQTGTLLNFLDRMRGDRALILAGDLNIRNERRYAHFTLQARATNAGMVCVRETSCVVAPGTKPKHLVRDTNDYHFLFEGTGYRIEPIAMARTYADKVDGKRLSDHSAFEATYRLTPK